MYTKQKINSNNTFEHSHKFYQPVANFSEIDFTNDEMMLLNKGLKYDIPSFKSNSVIHELMCIEAAIKSINNNSDQEETEAVINSKVNRLIKKGLYNTNMGNKYKHDIRNAWAINDKIQDNDALVMKADKDIMLVIVKKDVYNRKVYEFIENNNIKN